MIATHKRVCEGFASVAAQGQRWDAPSPCSEWDARAVVEHVIGFHEVLILRPLGVRATRPRDDPAARWAATSDALFAALDEHEPPSVLPTLTTDVLVHTWDLGRAFGLDVELDAELCAAAYERARRHEDQLRASDMFGPPVAVADDADIQSKLLGVFGRDPAWEPPA